jgi:hypothetical protein
MTPSELHDLLVALLARQYGGSQRRWRMIVGPIRTYDIATHSHCNWSVDPSGSFREVAEVERVLDTFRIRHPIVIPG